MANFQRIARTSFVLALSDPICLHRGEELLRRRSPRRKVLRGNISRASLYVTVAWNARAFLRERRNSGGNFDPFFLRILTFLV